MIHGSRVLRTLGVALLLAVARPAHPAEPTPEETVTRYLEAVRNEKFDVAYDLISKAMRQGKARDAWIADQKAGMAFAEVKIFEFEVYPGKIEGDTAKVPNVLSSQDRFVNQLGLTEHELYILVREEEGKWKVDSQLIVEPPDIPKWFPRKPSTAPSSTPSPAAAGVPVPAKDAKTPPAPPAP